MGCTIAEDILNGEMRVIHNGPAGSSAGPEKFVRRRCRRPRNAPSKSASIHETDRYRAHKHDRQSAAPFQRSPSRATRRPFPEDIPADCVSAYHTCCISSHSLTFRSEAAPPWLQQIRRSALIAGKHCMLRRLDYTPGGIQLNANQAKKAVRTGRFRFGVGDGSACAVWESSPA